MLSDVTHLHDAIDSGAPKAAEELLPPIFDELRRVAAGKIASERAGQTLPATALVYEAWQLIHCEERVVPPFEIDRQFTRPPVTVN